MQYRHVIREKPPLSSAKEEAIMIVPTIKPDAPGTKPGDPGNGHVLVIDPKHQKFNGRVYFRKSSGSNVYKKNGKHCFLHINVYEFHCGAIPKGYVVHHEHRKPDGSFDKEENNIDSLKFRPMMSLPSLMTMNTIWKFASAPSA